MCGICSCTYLHLWECTDACRHVHMPVCIHVEAQSCCQMSYSVLTPYFYIEARSLAESGALLFELI